MNDEVDLPQPEPSEEHQEQDKNRSRRNKVIDLLLFVMVLGVIIWVFVKVRNESAARANDLARLSKLKLMFFDLTDFSGNQAGDTVNVTFSEETVILKGPEILAYLKKPNSEGKHATLFRNGSASNLSPKELEEKLKGHTVIETLIPESPED
ncbi:hypothetical protein Enr10x_33560 [Gimesia panareensis]|uniref:Uncharacterized protein n=1 Tax=Gimesia panareensis TaxID=2527978 RepID=A0A517Q8T2_9PLAN|nr:hypothetical protein [Gimesia panareensis]QDT28017.1 hypothetical protein Enr10x_33560 [Gimesia panareensis]